MRCDQDAGLKLNQARGLAMSWPRGMDSPTCRTGREWLLAGPTCTRGALRARPRQVAPPLAPPGPASGWRCNRQQVRVSHVTPCNCDVQNPIGPTNLPRQEDEQELQLPPSPCPMRPTWPAPSAAARSAPSRLGPAGAALPGGVPPTVRGKPMHGSHSFPKLRVGAGP